MDVTTALSISTPPPIALQALRRQLTNSEESSEHRFMIGASADSAERVGNQDPVKCTLLFFFIKSYMKQQNTAQNRGAILCDQVELVRWECVAISAVCSREPSMNHQRA